MSSLSTVYVHYLRNYYRSRSFYLMLILILMISSLMTYFSFRYYSKVPEFLASFHVTSLPPVLRYRVFAYFWAFVLTTVPVFASVFFGSPAISGEMENRTAYHIFQLPVGRFTLYSGKYLAALTVSVIIALIYIAFQVAVLRVLLGMGPVPQFYISLGMLLLFISTIMSITFMVSTFFSRNMYAYITVLIAYYIVLDALNIILQLLYNIDPYYLLNNVAASVEEAYLDVNITGFGAPGSLSPMPYATVARNAYIMVLYLVVAFVIGALIFERREVK
ncbi:hypothetical protein GCM10007108_15950 [Thermogymnomonas acidicola]|uniref:ABC transporter permease n=1 Tax=Thermogymnomonas acidicola TaxID=399579 RepID=A0AA37BSH7_9ARCH|nr:ABC transporter permease [Thermogymnomonas acidicola]GGM78582.1 hypothetical protein GCM10007108_15950 [Thermogymnomonas acidicola]